jgi:hypothetical protein
MVPGIARCIVRDLWDIIDPKDKAYFRETREAWLGSGLERSHSDRIRAFIASLISIAIYAAASTIGPHASRREHLRQGAQVRSVPRNNGSVTDAPAGRLSTSTAPGLLPLVPVATEVEPGLLTAPVCRRRSDAGCQGRRDRRSMIAVASRGARSLRLAVSSHRKRIGRAFQSPEALH